MTLDELAYDSGDDVYYSEGFRTVLQSYFMFFKDPNNNVLTSMTLDPLAPIQYNGDLGALLLSLQIDPAYHWFIMILNGMNNPSDFGPQFTELLLPDLPTIERIKSTYLTSGI